VNMVPGCNSTKQRRGAAFLKGMERRLGVVPKFRLGGLSMKKVRLRERRGHKEGRRTEQYRVLQSRAEGRTSIRQREG